jgi:hypothetical protein
MDSVRHTKLYPYVLPVNFKYIQQQNSMIICGVYMLDIVGDLDSELYQEIKDPECKIYLLIQCIESITGIIFPNNSLISDAMLIIYF